MISDQGQQGLIRIHTVRIITVYMIICIILYTGISIKHGNNKKTNNETPLLLDMDRSEEWRWKNHLGLNGFRGMDMRSSFSAISLEGDNFCHILFALLHTKTFL